MNFRTTSDLFATVRRNMHKLPTDFDLIVGIPKSGMLGAFAVALLSNKPITDLSSFLDGRVYNSFSPRSRTEPSSKVADYRSVLVIDDSVFSGAALRNARAAIKAAGLRQHFSVGAIYGLGSVQADADFILESCPAPRVFEWNVMNHWCLEFSCVDLDGVLCMDPNAEQNDDGALYVDFLRTTKAINQPKYKIHSIVTSRLEKYRPETEAWLENHGFCYGNLFMLNLSSANERRQLGIHADFKAKIYGSQKDCLLFIESELWQAQRIRALTRKSVLAYKDMIFLSESAAVKTKKNIRLFAKSILPKPIIDAVKQFVR